MAFQFCEYTIFLCNQYFIQVDGDVSNITVADLLGHTAYSCTIFGYSQVTGPISDPLSVTTLQGGKYMYSLLS